MKTLILFLFCSTCCFSQNVYDLESESWSEEKPLVWEDFKGKPVKNSRAAAQTSSGIGFGFSIGKTGNRVTDFKVDVECFFYPTESWYKPEDASPHILNHEQMHFNITELHARMFRYQITFIKPSRQLQKELNKLYKDISTASAKMQALYDAETDHSINKAKQTEWNIYIAEELKKLNAFKTK